MVVAQGARAVLHPRPALGYPSRTISASLAAPGPRPGPGSPQGSSTSGLAPRRRVAASVAEAPPHTQDTDDLLIQELLDRQELLDAAYWRGPERASPAAPCDDSEGPSEAEEPYARSASSAGASTSTPALVPSTRKGRARRGRSVKAAAKRGPRVPQLIEDRLDTVPEAPAAGAGGGADELDADAEFMARLRTWLRNNRTAGRGKGGALSATTTYTTFMSSLGNIPVLTAAQEQRLARVIGRGNRVRDAAASLAAASRRRPSLDDVAAAAGLADAAAAARAVVLAEGARGLMVEFNLRMVISIAKRYVGKGLDAGDLIPEGIIGLKKAIERFDPGRGFKFSTYAHWWIRQAVTRAISEQGRDVRLPVHVVETLMKLNKVRRELSSLPGRDGPPTHRELAAAMGVPLPRLVALMRSTRDPRSVEDLAGIRAATGAGGVKGMGAAGPSSDDVWAEEDDDFASDALAHEERVEHMRETMTLLLSTLDTRERNVMRLRYGLHYSGSPAEVRRALQAIEEELEEAGRGRGADLCRALMDEDVSVDVDTGDLGLGLKATGALYDLSRERIRQVEAKALKKLRSPWRLRLLQLIREGEALSAGDLERLMAGGSDGPSPFH